MVDAITSNSNSLLRAQAVNSVVGKQQVTPSQVVAANLQKTAAVPVKSTAVPQSAKLAGSTSGNLPRGSLYDITV